MKLAWVWIGGWTSWYWSGGILALGPLRIFRPVSNQDSNPKES